MVRKAKNEDAVEVSSEKPARKSRGNERGVGGLFRFTLITVLGSIIAVLAGAWAVQTRVIDVMVAENGQRLAGIYARQYSVFYNQVFTQTSRQLASVSATDNVAKVLAGGDPAAIDATAATIAASLAGKSQVFLVPEGADVSNIPLGFAAQSMVERARAGENVKAEVIPLKANPMLLLAYPVRDTGKEIVGVVLAGFDLNEVGANLKGFDSNTGYMTLQQNFDDGSEPRTVMAYGDASQQGSPFTTAVETVHPNLSVSFALSPDANASNARQLFWIFIAGMALLVLASIVLTNLLLRRVLERNGSMLLQFAESLVQRGPSPAGIHFTLDVFDDIAHSLGRSARNNSSAEMMRQAAAAPAARRPSMSTPQDADDATRLSGGAFDTPDDDATRVSPAAPAAPRVADEIFRAYDIRGVVGKTLTDDTMLQIGKSIGTEALENGQTAIYVGRDGRLSGPQLLEHLIKGITSTGCNVVNLGMVPTPLVYFAAATTAVKSGVMLTGSHNPPDYNGLKMVINGTTLAEDRIQGLKERIHRQDFRTGNGSAETMDINGKYVERIRDDIVLARPMKIVVDCGNGVAGAIAPQLLKTIGCQVTPLFCDVDGHFPNHHPDPSKPENLKDLIAAVVSGQADLGLAFDGDGDRIGVVTPKGDVIWPDRLMMLYAKDLLMRTPGADIIFDVKCTRDLATVISQNGGRPIMWRTGHSLIKAKLKETGAALAGEMSGHIFFNDRWYGFDDALYSAARLLEILSLELSGADEVFAEFPSNMTTPELHITVTEESKFRIVEALQAQGDFPGGSVSTIDGVRVDYPDAWGLVRASNTTPVLVARFEGRTGEDLDRVRDVFREQLQKVEPSLRITF